MGEYQRRDLELKPLPGSRTGSLVARWALRFIVTIGLAGVGFGVYRLIDYSLTPSVIAQGQDPLTGGTLSNYDAQHSFAAAPAAKRIGLWIEIPSLRIALPVREGDGSDNVPSWVALHYPGTAYPGHNGNSALYAHGVRGMFGTLLLAKGGEEVLLHNYTTGSQQVLHVSRVVGLVRWNDVSWIYAPSNTPMLTLQTCVNIHKMDDRWMVIVT
jgi:LPXTG-site transpeptidase (sortase) family protein